jgi:hypothetical protein
MFLISFVMLNQLISETTEKTFRKDKYLSSLQSFHDDSTVSFGP